MNANKPIGKNYVNRASNTVAEGYKTTRDATIQAYGKFKESSILVQVLIVFVIIILLIVVIGFIKYLYDRSQFANKEEPFIVTTPINAFNRNNRPVRSRRVPFPVDGLEFTYSFWIYIADWNYNFGNWKNIFIKGDENKRAPGLWLYPKSNTLHARINTHADYNEGCDVRNIPLQKWVHIVYILNNRTVDIYIDGKLERSCVLRGVPILNNDPVIIGNDGGFYGQIAKMQYFTRALIPSEVAEIYSEGPYMSRSFTIGTDDNNNNGNNGDNCNNE